MSSWYLILKEILEAFFYSAYIFEIMKLSWKLVSTFPKLFF